MVDTKNGGQRPKKKPKKRPIFRGWFLDLEPHGSHKKRTSEARWFPQRLFSSKWFLGRRTTWLTQKLRISAKSGSLSGEPPVSD